MYFCLVKVLEAIGFRDMFNWNHDGHWVLAVRIEMIEVVVNRLGSQQEFYSSGTS